MRTPTTLRRHRLVTSAGSVKGDPLEVKEASQRLHGAGYPARVECATITLMPSGVEILDPWVECSCEMAAPVPKSEFASRMNQRCNNCDHRRGEHVMPAPGASGECTWRTRDADGVEVLCLCISYRELIPNPKS